jgi:hypothetical protein
MAGGLDDMHVSGLENCLVILKKKSGREHLGRCCFNIIASCLEHCCSSEKRLRRFMVSYRTQFVGGQEVIGMVKLHDGPFSLCDNLLKERMIQK